MYYSELTKEEIMDGIKNGSILFFDLPESKKNDKEIALVSIKVNSHSLRYVSDRLRDDKDIILEAVKENGFAIDYSSERLRKDKEVLLEAVKQNGLVLLYALKELENNKDLLEVLENSNTSGWLPDAMIWYKERMVFLVNLRNKEEKEFLENSIISNNRPTSKIKF